MGQAWKKHRMAAVALVRNERARGFTGDEKNNLLNILKGRNNSQRR